MSESSQVDLTSYENSDLLVFTDAAASKVKDLIEEERNDDSDTSLSPIIL